MSDSNFASASSAAASHLSSQPTDSNTPAPDTSGSAGNTQLPGSSTTEPAGQQIFKVKDNGKDVDVTLEDLLSGHLRHRDYTRKTMEIAEQRKQVEALQQATHQREAQMNEFLRDAQQVAAYYQYLTGQQLSAGQVQQLAHNQNASDPSAAIQEMRKEMMGEMAKVQHMTQNELAKFQQVQVAARAADFEREIAGTIKSLLSNPEFDALNDIGEADEISDFICSKAMQMGPRNLDEAKEAILNVAKGKLEHLSTRRKEMLKKSAVNSDALSKQGIEPPGGSGVSPKPHKFKLGDKGLSEAATAWLQAQGKK